MNRPDNPPAFPNYLQMAPQDGMTLRDYFAAKALQGLLTDPSMRFGGDYDSLTAKMAYSLADAMLGVR